MGVCKAWVLVPRDVYVNVKRVTIKSELLRLANFDNLSHHSFTKSVVYCVLSIDATRSDGLGRLCNDEHRKPNAVMKKVEHNGVHLCIFALKSIKLGDELRYDYGPDDGSMLWRYQISPSIVNRAAAPSGLIPESEQVSQAVATGGQETESVQVSRAVATSGQETDSVQISQADVARGHVPESEQVSGAVATSGQETDSVQVSRAAVACGHVPESEQVSRAVATSGQETDAVQVSRADVACGHVPESEQVSRAVATSSQETDSVQISRAAVARGQVPESEQVSRAVATGGQETKSKQVSQAAVVNCLVPGFEQVTGAATNSCCFVSESELVSPTVATSGQVLNSQRVCRAANTMSLPKSEQVRRAESIAFLKFEDMNCSHQPQFRQYSSFESLNLLRGPSDGIFNEPACRNMTSKGGDEKHWENRWSKKAGFCECCKVEYHCVSQHVKGFQHRMFARTSTNYEAVEAQIADLTLEQLLCKFSTTTTDKMPSTIDEKQGALVSVGCLTKLPLKRRLVEYSNSNTSSLVSQIFV